MRGLSGRLSREQNQNQATANSINSILSALVVAFGFLLEDFLVFLDGFLDEKGDGGGHGLAVVGAGLLEFCYQGTVYIQAQHFLIFSSLSGCHSLIRWGLRGYLRWCRA